MLCQEACGSQTVVACAAHAVSVYKSVCVAPGRVCLQEPVLHLCGSVYNSLCCTCVRLSTRTLCCTWTCLSSTACTAPGRVCLQQPVLHMECLSTRAFVLHLVVSVNSLCCICACLTTRPPANAVPVGVKFRFVSKRYRYMFETPKQNEKLFFGFMKQTERPKQIEFRFFPVLTENGFMYFRGHPTVPVSLCSHSLTRITLSDSCRSCIHNNEIFN
jgi:hypothetical protein